MGFYGFYSWSNNKADHHALLVDRSRAKLVFAQALMQEDASVRLTPSELVAPRLNDHYTKIKRALQLRQLSDSCHQFVTPFP